MMIFSKERRWTRSLISFEISCWHSATPLVKEDIGTQNVSRKCNVNPHLSLYLILKMFVTKHEMKWKYCFWTNRIFSFFVLGIVQTNISFWKERFQIQFLYRRCQRLTWVIILINFDWNSIITTAMFLSCSFCSIS